MLPGHGEVDTIVCDVDGVLLLGEEPVPGAREALETLSESGLRIVFATNNSTRHPAETSRHVGEVVGFELDPSAVMNSGLATARFIAGNVDRVYVLGSEGLRETLREAGIRVTADWREADAVVTGMDFEVTYARLAGAGLAIGNGAKFYATNTDAAYPRSDGLYPGAGAITAVVEVTTGVSPIVCGKPHEPMRSALRDLCGSRPIIVGDRPDTDIAMGKAEGWPSVLVLSGVVADAVTVAEEHTPDVVLDSFADLPGLLGLD